TGQRGFDGLEAVGHATAFESELPQVDFDQAAQMLDVLGYQHFSRKGRSGHGHRVNGSGLGERDLDSRNADSEFGSLAGNRADLERPFHELDELARDRKTEPGPLGARSGDPMERLEH